MWNATFKTGLNSSKYGIHTFSFISPSTGTHERNKSTSSRLSGFIAIGRALQPSEVAWICLASENGLKGNWRQKDNFFYHAQILFSTFFWRIRRFSTSIAAQNGGVSGFCSLWRMIWGRHARASHIEAVFLIDVCREYWVSEETAKQQRTYPQQHLFLLIPDIIRHSRVLI